MCTIELLINVTSFNQLNFIVDENANNRKQAYRGHGRGASREREKDQVSPWHGKEKPFGEWGKGILGIL